MRKAIAVAGMTGVLTFGGAGIANATTYEIPAPTTTTTVAQTEMEHDDDSGDNGLWGLAGLLGLLGLLGLKRRSDRPVTSVGTAAPGYGGTTPRT